MKSTVTVTPLTSSIGARLTGVDLHADLEPGVPEVILDAFAKHSVLVFPNGAPVGPDEQLRLARVFGEPQPLAIFQFLGAPKPVTALGSGSGIKVPDRAAPRRGTNSDFRIAGDNNGWHTDSSFTPWLPRAAVLRAEVIPPVGGDTSFISLCAAYEGLSPVMKDFLQTLNAVHAYTPYYKEAINVWQYGDDAEERFDAEYAPREHPLVIRHPETGKPALFANPVYTVQIAGMSRQESDAILRFLYQHIASTEYVYRHHWSDGDVVVWDELTALHRAPTDFAPHDRKVVRVTAGRTVPTALAGARANLPSRGSLTTRVLKYRERVAMYLDKVRLDGRVAVVVGAGGGRMGTESAVALAEAGAVVVGMDLSGERLAQAQEQVSGLGGSFIPMVVDVADPGAFGRAMDEIQRDAGVVQHLVHVVGGNRPQNYRVGGGVAADAGLASLDSYSDERFEAIIDFNLVATFRTCRDVARRLIEAELPGTIVTFSAIAGLNGSPGIGAYGAAKAAVIALTRTMAVEWGRYGLRVNSVAPGQTQSARPRAGAAFLDSDMVNVSLYPLGHAADVTDIASTVLYLSTGLSSSVTGQTIIVDGGVTSRLQILTTPGPTP